MNQTTKEPAVRTAAKPHMSASPHLRNRLTTGKVMLQVLLSLLPAAVDAALRGEQLQPVLLGQRNA